MRTNGANGGQVGLDCISDGHLLIDWKSTGNYTVRQKTDPIPVVGRAIEGIRSCWCLWCGTASYNGDTVTDETPT
jgi:hypothetical protein